MKFGDKLLGLRKKNGLSQEELAEKLGVSRQSVSKWESNNAYPETDKIVQICNLFDCSMDDLINDQITDLKQIERKEKNNIAKTMDSFLEYITKTVNMFSDMTFGSGFKCVLKMGLLALLLFFVGLFVVGVTSTLIGNLFSFLNHYDIIQSIITSILRILWFILSVVIILYVFKIRYLDYYVKVKDSDEEDKNGKIKLEKKDNIVITGKETRSYEFISTLSKILKFIVKIVLVFIILEIIPLLIASSITFIISLIHVGASSLFIGTTLISISSILMCSVFLIIFINFIFEKKSKILIILIMFLSSLVLFGIGIGITVMSFKNFKIEHASSLYKDKVVLDNSYSDNLVIQSSGLRDVDYKFDENLGNDIKIEVKYYKKFNEVESKTEDYYGANVFIVKTKTKDVNLKDMYDEFIKDIKNNVLREYDDGVLITVISSKETIDKLIDNSSKVYVFDKKDTSDGYKLENIRHRISEHNNCEKDTKYNAFTNELIVPDNCKCEKIEQEDNIEINCE